MTSLNIADILPYKKDNHLNFKAFTLNNSIELTEVGIKPETLLTYSSELRVCKERLIPVFLYHNLSREIKGYSIFSSTFKEHLLYNQNEPSFFFLKTPRLTITKLIICSDPIELLSYHQINKSRISDSTLLIAPHPHLKISLYSVLGDFFEKAKFHNLYTKSNSLDILSSIAINLSLSKEIYSIKLCSPYINITVGNKEYTSDFNNINKAFFWEVFRNQKLTVSNITPRFNNYTFNNLINEQ